MASKLYEDDDLEGCIAWSRRASSSPATPILFRIKYFILIAFATDDCDDADTWLNSAEEMRKGILPEAVKIEGNTDLLDMLEGLRVEIVEATEMINEQRAFIEQQEPQNSDEDLMHEDDEDDDDDQGEDDNESLEGEPRNKDGA
ncbi:hypothetical protein M011DRAFT_482757 [Sporormia fimetaria CBS 119925]|uniref:Uncharacterized protein n=1 Tax=Sporormia fimetaria CBS 119925 TaxID=1340428 RepID=A0A6A6VQC0_9PLEO|nr:hypothetical protein M011DRAFT_482757 [Sporormia fimetaria CBS 119925]